MKKLSNNSINVVEIKSSKTDLPVPVINGVHLHSIYNPEREAESFVSASENNLKKNSDLLIFGLGFGYHLAKIEARMKALYGDDYRIFVIEPHNELYKKWKELKPNILSPRVKVVHYSEVKDFYKDKELVSFLSDKPSILPHPASFQLNESFYKTFMTFHYPTSLKESLFFIEDSEFAEYLQQQDLSQSTDEFTESIKSKPFIQGNDFIALALKEMIGEEQR
jgi:hypothetical protein